MANDRQIGECKRRVEEARLIVRGIFDVEERATLLRLITDFEKLTLAHPPAL